MVIFILDLIFIKFYLSCIKPPAIALLFFMVLPLISFAGAAFSYVRNNERKSHLMGKTLVDSSTM